MQNSCVSLFSYLPTPCGGTRVTLPEKSMPCPGGGSGAPRLFSPGTRKLGNGPYLHGRERRSAVRSGLQSTPVRESLSPRACVWTVRQPHCRNTGAPPHHYVRRQKASELFCSLGIWKRERNLLFVNPRRKQKPAECGCGYYLGVLRVTFILQIEPNTGKKSDVNAARDIGIRCLLCSRCVFSSSPTHRT